MHVLLVVSHKHLGTKLAVSRKVPLGCDALSSLICITPEEQYLGGQRRKEMRRM